MNLIVNKIKEAGKILIVPSDPDLDGLGSAIGLKIWLENMGKVVEAKYFRNLKAEYLRTAYDVATHLIRSDIDGFNPEDFDLLIMLDASEDIQMFEGEMIENGILDRIDSENTILFDHHEQHNLYDIINQDLIAGDPTASCTAQVIYATLGEDFKQSFQVESASHFYKALLGDTGTFRWELTSGAFRFAADLLDAGVDWGELMNFSSPFEDYQFTAWAINNVERFDDARLTVLEINKQDEQELLDMIGADWVGHTGPFKNGFGKHIAGYDFLFFLTISPEQENQIKMTWRMKDTVRDFDIREVMEKYGYIGGGHKNAGGGYFDGTMQDAKQNIINMITENYNVSKN